MRGCSSVGDRSDCGKISRASRRLDARRLCEVYVERLIEGSQGVLEERVAAFRTEVQKGGASSEMSFTEPVNVVVVPGCFELGSWLDDSDVEEGKCAADRLEDLNLCAPEGR